MNKLIASISVEEKLSQAVQLLAAEMRGRRPIPSIVPDRSDPVFHVENGKSALLTIHRSLECGPFETPERLTSASVHIGEFARGDRTRLALVKIENERV